MKFVLFLISLLHAYDSFGWGKTGHRVVAEIAEFHLKPAKKKVAHALLNGETLAQVSDWMDFERSNPQFKKYEDWHYQNFEDKKTNGKLIFAINECIKKISQGSREEKALHLKILVHLIGDLHQPMHLGKASDLGGNLLKVEWFGQKTNLHSVWDENFINFQELSFSEYKSFLIARYGEYRSEWEKDNLDVWVQDILLKTALIYDHKDFKLGYEYNYKFKSTLDISLYQAGIRLATLLNKYL
jgi:hypothetical protein